MSSSQTISPTVQTVHRGEVKEVTGDETVGKRKSAYSIRGMVMFLTLVALVFYFYLPTSIIEFDVYSEAPPVPESRIEIFQFEPGSTVTKTILNNVYVNESFEYQPDPNEEQSQNVISQSIQKLVKWNQRTEIRRCSKYRLRLRLTGFQRSQLYIRKDKDIKTYVKLYQP